MPWSSPLLARACVAWLPLVPLAILNGLLREALLAPWLGSRVALPVSGLLLTGLVVGYAWLVTPWLRRGGGWDCRVAGLAWLVLTLVFEFPFAHYVLGTPWSAMFASLDPTRGNLMFLVLLATACGPCLGARWHAGTSRGSTPRAGQGHEHLP